jgi:[acyl-carrier-protein] S-malonyltransferase
MGRALYDHSAAARDVFERADAALGRSISRLCFEGSESELALTANTQPAILTVSIAALAALKEAAPTLPAPVFAAGHSLGEYSALVAAGGLSLEDAVRLVELRGQAMQQAVPSGEGSMAAIVGGDSDSVAALCREAAGDEVLAPANYNAPGQTVIAGATAAVKRALDLAPARKLKGIILKVSAPFHCALMMPAARVVEQALASINVGSLAFPVIANVDAEPNQDGARVGELLVRQVSSPVRWEQSMRYAVQHGVTRALEIGPGKVLAGLLRRVDKNVELFSVADSDAVQNVRRVFG